MDVDAAVAVMGADVEITSVERLEAGKVDALVRFGIDQPVPSSRTEGCDFIVAGWVLHPERRVSSVQVVARDETIGWGGVHLDRPDISTAFPNVARGAKAGFQFATGVVGLPRTFECTLEANLDDGRRVPLARIRGTRTPLAVHESTGPQPLVVTSLGRCGSTFLVGMLSAHPRIVVHREVPYETRALSYWMHVFRVLARPANHARAGDRDTFVYNRHFVGQNPFYTADRGEPAALRTWYARTGVERLAAFCRDEVESFYSAVAEANGQQAPRYFAEKGLGSVVLDQGDDLYPRGRQIFLVRDFRDMVASILAFNAKRGYQAFGRQDFGTDDEYVRQLGVSAREIHVAWRERATRSLLVKYEDLVATPRTALATILEYLELDAGPDVVDTMIGRVKSVPELQDHTTTPDAASSVGRWRFDLDQRLQDVCIEAFGPVLSDFGYPVAATV